MEDAKEMYEMGKRLCQMAEAMGYSPDAEGEEDPYSDHESADEPSAPVEGPSKGQKAAIIIALKKKMKGGE